jgi:sugar phosphate isomerase/epimerase
MKKDINSSSRRDFLRVTGSATGLSLLASLLPIELFSATVMPKGKVLVSGHLWVYASKFPPDWDCTPVLDTVFSDFKYAGLSGVEVMETNLRHDDAVQHFSELIEKYNMPLTGSSYNADMWNKDRAQQILEDVSMIVERLAKLGASTFGITVGDAQRLKTEKELDAQADVLTGIIKICNKNRIQPNLHNHTFEVKDGLHDLKGTLARIPGVNLGPDLNWLIRAGVDPVWFIETYGKQIVYLHIRDQYSSGKWTEYLGQGATDFPAIAAALKKVDFNGRAAIELAFDTEPQHPLKEDWKISRQYVRGTFGW